MHACVCLVLTESTTNLPFTVIEVRCLRVTRVAVIISGLLCKWETYRLLVVPSLIMIPIKDSDQVGD